MIARFETSALKAKLLLTVAETCEAMSISRRTLYTLTASRGKLPSVSIGNAGVRYSVASIQKWIADREAAAKSDQPATAAAEGVASENSG